MSGAMDHDNANKYRLKYKIEVKHGEFTKSEVMHSGDNFGGCDALFVASILKSDKDFNVVFFGVNELGIAMDLADEFKVWTLLSARLLQSQLPDAMKKIASDAHESVMKLIQAGNVPEKFILDSDSKSVH
jgi:hypothetical protein